MSKRTKSSRLDLFTKILELSFKKIPKVTPCGRRNVSVFGRKDKGFP
ncbi:hypothetical protein LDL59_03685 [Kaistella anthropi]|nr:hypothetical protein [Kaistella anthropi]